MSICDHLEVALDMSANLFYMTNSRPTFQQLNDTFWIGVCCIGFSESNHYIQLVKKSRKLLYLNFST